MINGKNFHLKRDEVSERLGFFTTRFVEASSIEEAELTAINLIKQDSWLRSATLNDKNDPPMLYVDEIAELSELPEKQGFGFTFYPDRDDTDIKD